jgi:hypothetical protein
MFDHGYNKRPMMVILCTRFPRLTCSSCLEFGMVVVFACLPTVPSLSRRGLLAPQDLLLAASS